MKSALNNQVVVLNRNWLPVHAFTARQAISQMCAGASTGIDVSENAFRAVPWEEWLKLPVRPQDGVIHCKSQNVRCPTIVICLHYSKIPKKNQKFTLANIAKRDGYKDAYTGEPLHPDDWSLDHVDPRGQGGPNIPENVVLQKKKDNNRKGCRTPEQAGLKRPHIKPLLMQTPVEVIQLTHPDHALILGKFKG